MDMIFVIEDNEIMAECIARACGKKVRVFADAITAMDAISNGEVPELIILDILLDGPDGFTFLNEMMSYTDTARIPVVIVSSINLDGKDLGEYGVVGILNKDNMMPRDIKGYVEKYAK